MVIGRTGEDGKVHFSFSKCDGMFQHYNSVDKEWFNKHNTESITAEELDSLAWSDKENSKVTGKISCWGLG